MYVRDDLLLNFEPTDAKGLDRSEHGYFHECCDEVRSRRMLIRRFKYGIPLLPLVPIIVY